MKFDNNNPQVAGRDRCHLCELELTLTPKQFADRVKEGQIYYGN